MTVTEVKNEAVFNMADGELPTVLFVCTGNTCRSPMAEAYLKNKGTAHAFSRGIAAHEGDPIAENAVAALRCRGILPTENNGYENHRAKNISAADLDSADIAVAMSWSHAKALMFAFPQFASKVTVLGGGISDPFGGDIELYKKTLDEITSEIDKMFV